MAEDKHTAAGRGLTELIVEVFRLNGRLLVSGDRLVAELGLTSARWQVLGAIDLAETPQPVAWLARSMGLNRQGVQRVVNELATEGFVEFGPNPHHRRAHLVALTNRGRAAYAAVQRRQIPWVNALAKGLHTNDVKAATELLATVRQQLEAEINASSAANDG